MLKKSILTGFAIMLFPAIVYAVDWDLTLNVSIPYTGAEGEVAKNKLIAGINQTATDGPDNIWDTPGLFTDILKAYFLHSDFPGSRQHLWRDIRADHLPQEWEILVQPSQAGASVTLSWSAETLSSLPSNIRIRLVDLDGGSQEQDMRSASIYTYVHADSTLSHHFRIIADEPVVSAPSADTSPPPSSTPPVETPPGENPPQDSTPALNILTDQLPPGILGKLYKARLEAQGGTTPYRWKVVGGKLPVGLKLNAATGTISGKPRRLGQYRMMIQLVDANGLIVQKAFTLSIIHRGRPFK